MRTSNSHQKLSRHDIESISCNILKKFTPHILETPQQTPISLIIEKHLSLYLDYQYLSKDNNILGMTSFTDGFVEVFDDSRRNKHFMKIERGTILIDRDLCDNNGRKNFTLAHESGHWILHRNIGEEIFRCSGLSRQLESNEDWLEWQADTFSASILMPKKTFIEAYNGLWKETNQIPRVIRQGKNDEWDSFVEYAAEYLSDIFQVSQQAAMIRLKTIGFLTKS